MIAIMSEQPIDLFRRLSATSRRLDKAAFLFHAQDPVAALYVVEDGQVHLLRRQVDGTSLILQRARPGALVAEASLFSAQYHCDAVAVRPTGVLALAKSVLRAALANAPDLAETWLAHLAREVQTARLRAEILALRTVARRLDAWLAEHDGQLPERGNWRTLSGEIGVTPEALYRELAKRQDRPGPGGRSADFP